ncbi:hypothetical protein NTG1052_590006 [Candidatus Nitrotoga sp. 1052]|nr:hypothetical protein NTG1052_590006 [Candidatus Nitrotoga sp. 1052]
MMLLDTTKTECHYSFVTAHQWVMGLLIIAITQAKRIIENLNSQTFNIPDLVLISAY